MIKIGFCDFFEQFCPTNNFITAILDRWNLEYEVVEVNDANYVFFSVFGDKHWFVNDNCIKIFFTGENLAPNFNACDYAIGFEWMDYGDRYFRYPLYLAFSNISEEMEHKHEVSDGYSIFEEKLDFCSFIYSNGRANSFRQRLFEELSKYKKVDSGGRWMNNIGAPVTDKLEFEKRHKFSIACENSAHPGYTTEKLVQAFAARTVPIYWGDPWVGKVFNTQSFINASDFTSVEDVVKRVIEVDTNSDLYMSMLKEPALRSDVYSSDNQRKLFFNFLDNIFRQPVELARRRNRDYWGKMYIERQESLRNVYENQMSLKNHFMNDFKQSRFFKIIREFHKHCM